MTTEGRVALDRDGLERTDPRPLHAQISEAIRDRIASGVWPPNYQLHAEPRLADELGVSRGTIRRALRTLIEDQLLVQVHGKGTFVRPRTVEPAIAQELMSLSDAFEREGVTLLTEVMEQAITSAPATVAGLLDLDVDAPALRLVRRRGDDRGWVALFENYVRADLCPGIEGADFATRKLFDVVERDHGLRLTSARRSFAAVAASPRVAAALECPDATPVMHLEQVTYVNGGQPIEYSDVWIKGDSLRLSSFLRRV